MTRFYDTWFKVGSYLNLGAKYLSRLSVACLLVGASFGTSARGESGPQLAGDEPLLIKAVVVTMFEHGAPEGDRPGEMQLWVERYPF
ncbi:MAG: hypothetical protein ACO3L6_07845, partial [Dehalococcoidia bacterium]